MYVTKITQQLQITYIRMAQIVLSYLLVLTEHRHYMIYLQSKHRAALRALAT